MAALQMDNLHEIIDNLGAENGFDPEEDYEVVVVDENTFKPYSIKEVYADSETGRKILSLVINTGEKHE